MTTPEPPPPGRRATNRAARAAFTAARNRGLVARHRTKLRNLAERGINPVRSLNPSDEQTHETHTDDGPGDAA